MSNAQNRGDRSMRGPSSEVGARILTAARGLLAQGGLGAITISALEAEAGVYSSAIHYHFGSKSGLIAALVEQTLHENRLATEEALEGVPAGRSRVDAAFEHFNMIGSPDVQLAFFEMLGTIVRDEALRKRARELYVDAYELFVRALGGDGDAEAQRALRPLSEIALAFLDGLIVRQLLDGEADVRPALAVMKDMVMSKAQEIAVSSGSSAREVG